MATSIISKKDTVTDNDPKEDINSMQSSQSYQLQIQNQPPNFVFLGEPFTFDLLVVVEDHKHPEKICNSNFSSHANSTPSSQSDCKQNDATSDSSPTSIPLFDVFVELLAHTTQTPFSTHNSMKNIDNKVAENTPITDGTSSFVNVVAPNVASKTLHMGTARNPHQRQEQQNMLRLNILKNPSPITLGEFGTIQCSLTGANSLDDMKNQEHMLSLHQRKLAMSTSSSANSTIVMDTNAMTYQIRIMAILCRSHRQRKRTNIHRSTTDMPNPTTINSCIALTSSIAIVRHKILIASCSNDGISHGSSGYKNESIAGTDWNSVWYKDEGGRDKCMEINVGVYDRQHVALYEAIPLLLTLCYASSNQQAMKQNLLSLSPLLPIPVTNQEILNVLSPKPNQRFVDRDTGTIKIRFRVEDVSKNHQGQDFCLLIAAAALDNGDYHSSHNNYRTAMIAPAVSFSVNVRSKRNKRPRQFTTVSTSISIPTTDVSTEHVYPQISLVPSMGTILSTHANSRAIVDNYPRLTTMQLQDALRSVVQWIQDVVTRTTHELQRQDAQNGIVTQYLSSMSQSMTTYNGEVQEHLNMLQYITDFNSASLSSRSQADPNYNQAMHNSHENVYQRHQRQATTSDSFRNCDAGNFLYSQGYYHESTSSDGGNNRFHHLYPYQYQNQMYQLAPHTYRHQPAMMNDHHSLPSVADDKRHGPRKLVHPIKERELLDFPTNESTYVLRDEKFPLAVNKRQSPPQTPQINLRTTETAQETNVGSCQAYSLKTAEFQKAYSSNTMTYGSMDSFQIHEDHGENRESEVEYVFAKQFKSLRSGALLGYPAYTIQKELIGFYQQVQVTQSIDLSNAPFQHQRNDRKSSSPAPPLTRSHVFVPLPKEDFGATQLEHAKVVLDQADRSAIQAMSHCGSIEAMLHRALVFEWSQGLTNV